ncbi:hypothetical protein H0H92_002773 [Tricholoma furcatifolium]|nr:hypothetical protein H0H92_002773 [Tricholoma furcatifolium]
MLLSFPFAALLVVPFVNGEKCGSTRTPEQIALMRADFSNYSTVQNASEVFAPAATKNLKVYFHNIYENKFKSGGYIEYVTPCKLRSKLTPAHNRDTVIQEQIKVLNTGFKNMNIRWTLAGTTHEENSDWWKNVLQDSPKELAMKKKLRQGGVADLNVYTVRLKPKDHGFATFPIEYGSVANGKILDGVVINFGTVPGGSVSGANKGHTLIHEAGHWVGLFHTFENGCTPPGDDIADTPYEELPSYDCITKKSSCPNETGNNPIHNYMDYTPDACTNQFTHDQGTRITQQLKQYRKV